jgi:Ca2+:H+ antiporter
MVTVILCVFLLSYTYGEGKSNYFKGSILILAYLVVMAGFYISGYDIVEIMDAARAVGSRPGMETSWMAGPTRSGKGY